MGQRHRAYLDETVTGEKSEKIDFSKFDKPELIEALNIFNELNLLPSMQDYLVKKMNNSHFNRLTKERNDICIKVRPLLDKKRKTRKESLLIDNLIKQIDIKTKSREKSLKKLHELRMVDDKEYEELSLLNK